MQEAAPRKLAAILAADVAGYSRLMGQDEEATVRTLSDYRALIGRTVHEHQGRVFGGAGDSLVAEFNSPLQAVRCALAVQDRVAERNENLADDRRMRFRIGINLGDVIVDGNNLLGDGVNVAARLEGVAPPGGICISATVYDQVRTRIDAPISDLGRHALKNIDQPVHAYSVGRVRPRRRAPVRRRALTAGAVTAIVLAVVVAVFGIGAPTQPDNAAPIIVVLPFEAIGEDERLALIGEGLRQDLMVSLSDSTEGIRIIGVADPEAETAPEPDYVLRGSVRVAGETLRVTALLVDRESGFQLWGGRYDRAASQTATFQDDIAGRIVTSLSVRLVAAERERAAGTGMAEMVMDGLEQIGRFAEAAVTLPVELFRRAFGEPESASARASSMPEGR